MRRSGRRLPNSCTMEPNLQNAIVVVRIVFNCIVSVSFSVVIVVLSVLVRSVLMFLLDVMRFFFFFFYFFFFSIISCFVLFCFVLF